MGQDEELAAGIVGLTRLRGWRLRLALHVIGALAWRPRSAAAELLKGKGHAALRSLRRAWEGPGDP
jgi:hypothetical protein